MIIGSMRPEGGLQPGDLYLDQVSTLNSVRHPGVSMESDILLGICREHMHSRFSSLGVYVSEFVNKLRDEMMGSGRSGTLWFSSANDRETGPVIPLGCMPYSSIRTKIWNDTKDRWSFDGHMVRGWRFTLEALIAGGFLKWHEDLTYLIGKDTFQVAPKQYQ